MSRGNHTRGACPSLFSPMASGDGWLVRLRCGARALTSEQLRQLAALADAYGNGIIELTRRANLQLRGLELAGVPVLRARLIALGLVDESPLQEARPALLVDPVAALARTAGLAELAQALDVALLEHAAACSCSPKLGIVLDAGSGSLASCDADVRIVVTGEREAVRIYAADEHVGTCERERAPAVVRALLALLAQGSGALTQGNSGLAGPGARSHELQPTASAAPARRMRDLLAAGGLPALRACAQATPVQTQPSWRPTPPLPALGHHAADGGNWFGLGVPFGSAPHTSWQHIADLAEHFGAGTVRFTPNREVLLTGVHPERANSLSQAARTHGFIVDAGDPRRRILACSGAPACSAAHGPTRALATTLGLNLSADATLHVSGCEKGCASRATTDFNVVLAPGGNARLGVNADMAAASGAPIETIAALTSRLVARSRAHSDPR
jgi:precorrin-3B synthase